MAEKNLCILGNGAATMEAVKGLRACGYAGGIDLIADALWPTYNPMLTTYYLAGKIDFSGLFPYGYGREIYEELTVNLHLGSPVTALDTKEKSITVASGKTYDYSQCLIATGASPFLPPVPGLDSRRVFTVRTLEDALKLKEALGQKPKRALVVGASMVGIKVVELLRAMDLEVCLVDMASCIFPLAAHEQCARVIEKELVRRQVELRLGAAFEGIEEGSGGLVAHFAQGDSVAADLAVICIGVRPNLAFVDREQIWVDRGIVVDQHMRTNDPWVYAAGDVSQGHKLLTGENQNIGLWANARYQGRTAGRNMAGVVDSYKGNTLHNISHFMGMVFTGLGDLNAADRQEITQNDDSYVQLAWKGDKLVGVNLMGEACANSGIIKNALEKSLIHKEDLKRDAICSPQVRNRLLFNKLVKVR